MLRKCGRRTPGPCLSVMIKYHGNGIPLQVTMTTNKHLQSSTTGRVQRERYGFLSAAVSSERRRDPFWRASKPTQAYHTSDRPQHTKNGHKRNAQIQVVMETLLTHCMSHSLIHRPSIALQRKVGYSVRDHATQTKETEMVDLQHEIEVLQVLVQDAGKLRKDFAFTTNMLRANYEQQITDRSTEL